MQTLLMCALALTGTAHGAPDWHLDVGAQTEVPLLLGGFVRVEGPARLRLSLAVGAMPRPYLDLINNLAVKRTWYDEETAELVDASLKGSILFHPELGWRPLPNLGLNTAIGYQVVGLGGSVSSVELFETLTEMKVPPRIEEVAEDMDVGATLHMLTVRAGWDFVIAKRLVVGLSLGGAFTVGSRQRVEPYDVSLPDQPNLEEKANDTVQDVAAEGERRMGDIFTRSVHTPLIGLSIGGRIF
jgi:hypothetical protein